MTAIPQIVNSRPAAELGHSPAAQITTPQRTNSSYESYVDPEEGAAFLRMHPKTLMRLAREGIVPAYSYNDGSRRRWRFLLSELDTWMRSRVNSTAHPVRPRPADERRR